MLTSGNLEVEYQTWLCSSVGPIIILHFFITKKFIVPNFINTLQIYGFK